MTTLQPPVIETASVARTIRLLSRRPQDGAASTCGTELAQPSWDFDTRPGYGPGASSADVIPAAAPRQGEIPAEYRLAGEEELAARIVAAKRTLGERVVVLGHFYQRDEVVQHADYVGDSFQLANAALAHPDAEAIVFCGVHFMAETADILSAPAQSVVLPNLAAGCSMADMADIDQVEDAWAELTELYGTAPDADGRVPLVPVTYMNSSAAIKAFCGRHGGIVCTSSNARTVLDWAFERGQRVIFFPDQHLGRNTAKAMGVPLERMPLWRPQLPLGGNSEEALDAAQVILWNGFCSVHKRFTVAQIERARAAHPGVRVIVHPECPMAVVDAADENGSTDYIRKAIEAAPAGQVFAIGTEINLVQRLAAEHPEHTIFCLDEVVCPCSTMYRIHPGYLAWVLEALVRGETLNRITVDGTVAADARIALERMLAAKPPAAAPSAAAASPVAALSAAVSSADVAPGGVASPVSVLGTLAAPASSEATIAVAAPAQPSLAGAAGAGSAAEARSGVERRQSAPSAVAQPAEGVSPATAPPVAPASGASPVAPASSASPVPEAAGSPPSAFPQAAPGSSRPNLERPFSETAVGRAAC